MNRLAAQYGFGVLGPPFSPEERVKPITTALPVPQWAVPETVRIEFSATYQPARDLATTPA